MSVIKKNRLFLVPSQTPNKVATLFPSGVLMFVLVVLRISLSPFFSLVSFVSIRQEWKIDTQLSSRGGVPKTSKKKNGDDNHNHDHNDAPDSPGGGREIWL